MRTIGGRLPVPGTTFVGRAGELVAVMDLLASSRIVTLTGAGGCGKTRLALEVAAGQADRLGLDVAWVDLAPIADPTLVTRAVGSALSIADRPSDDPFGWLARGIQDRELLLVLDNCEHVVESVAALVEALREQCPGVRILTTSREPLAVAGETSYRVPSLPVPDGLQLTLETTSASAAVELFVDRASHARPGFALTEDNARHLTAICRRLDGIPLAIELAAARVRMMTAAQIADALDDRFTLLTGGPRSALPRQRTLEASVGWSFDLLTDEEKAVLRRLSVFAGGFDLPAVTALCGQFATSTLDLLTSLVDKSLVQVELSTGGSRFRLLETVRDYARHRLEQSDESAATRHRHLDIYLALAEGSELELGASDFISRLDALDLELDNLRAAMDWATASGQGVKALQIAGSLWLYWSIRTGHGEGRSRLGALLASHPEAPAAVRYKALLATLMLSITGEARVALPHARELLAIAEESGDARMRSQALAWVGQGQWVTGDVRGLEAMRESLLIARKLAEPSQLGRSLHWLGAALAAHGDVVDGLAMLDESIDILTRTHNDVQLAWATTWRGVAKRLAGDLGGAYRDQQDALSLLSARGEDTFRAVPLAELAMLAVLRGDLAEAEALATSALDIGRRSAACLVEGYAELALALLAHADGDPVRLWQHAGAAAAHFDDSGFVLLGGLALCLQASGLISLGERHDAEQLLQGVVRTCRHHPSVRSRALTCLASLSLADSGASHASELLHDAVGVSADGNDLVSLIDSLEELASLLAATEKPRDAARLLAATERGRSDIGYERFASGRRAYADLLAGLADALGAEQLEASRSEGARLSLLDAAAYARRGRGEHRRALGGWNSLTPTEVQVAGLVAAGFTNPQIAAALFIARNTVKAHLGHIYSKLGVTTRSGLAAVAARQGI